jgi:hypothetical protein
MHIDEWIKIPNKSHKRQWETHHQERSMAGNIDQEIYKSNAYGVMDQNGYQITQRGLFILENLNRVFCCDWKIPIWCVGDGTKVRLGRE